MSRKHYRYSKYHARRAKSGLNRYDIAKELGIPYDKYVQIEKGEIAMPSCLLDKFNSIVSRGQKINKIEVMSKEKGVSEWIEQMRVKRSDTKGDFELLNVMKSFNISTYRELGKLLGCNQSSISNLLIGRATNINLQNRLFDFFHDELNKQPERPIPEKCEKRKYIKRVKVNSETKDEMEDLKAEMPVLPKKPEKIENTDNNIQNIISKEIKSYEDQINLKLIEIQQLKNEIDSLQNTKSLLQNILDTAERIK